MPSLWDRVADLEGAIDDYAVQRRELDVSPQFKRVTTTVVLHGADETGQGEDVTYTAGDHDDFPAHEMLAGTWTLHEYSRRLDELVLFDREPQMEASNDYRRWAFESAALDLALRQAGTSFADAAGRRYRPGARRRLQGVLPRHVGGPCPRRRAVPAGRRRLPRRRARGRCARRRVRR